MGKDTNFIGQPVYVQLLNLVDRERIRKISLRGGHDRYVKKLDGYTHFVAFLFAVLMHHDTLRETVIGIMAEAHKLQHLGVDYLVRRSTLSDANNKRSSQFFKDVYRHLYNKYRHILSDSTLKPWEKQLYILDSTTITLFSTILKGAGRNPKHGKKKGGIKAHAVTRYDEWAPCFVDYTSAATHDIKTLKGLHFPEGSFLAIDRAYIDYSELERLTLEKVCYVTKMKKNLVYETLSSTILVTPDGKAEMKVSTVRFRKGEVTHTARMIEYWTADGRHATLLTNNFDMQEWDIVEVYARRWQIELLFKQLKQNFPLKYFYGESVNAIESQIWVTLIANLLLTVVRKRVRRRWAFSNLVTAVRQMLMYYVDIFAFLENPEQTWERINAGRCNSPTGQLELPFS
jgi:IS4 transposase